MSAPTLASMRDSAGLSRMTDASLAFKAHSRGDVGRESSRRLAAEGGEEAAHEGIIIRRPQIHARGIVLGADGHTGRLARGTAAGRKGRSHEYEKRDDAAHVWLVEHHRLTRAF